MRRKKKISDLNPEYPNLDEGDRDKKYPQLDRELDEPDIPADGEHPEQKDLNEHPKFDKFKGVTP